MLTVLAVVDLAVAVWLVVSGMSRRRIGLTTVGLVLVVCGITLWSLDAEEPSLPTVEQTGVTV